MISEKPLYQNIGETCATSDKKIKLNAMWAERARDLINNEKMQSCDHVKFILT